ncbi:hypothetical protein [Rhodobacter sp. NSM]|uniref:hypothetical protein n=1 Tax=Rhodobacter sp. NSM TaxID=3457501 RepID=UPI003FD3ACE3
MRGRLHPRLAPFLDAVLLEGVDPVHLDEMRRRAMAAELPVLRRSDGAALAKGYPSDVWRACFKTGAHIARTWIHTELGKFGPRGVEAALALCAQRDPRSRLFHQGLAVAEAQMRKSQDLMDELYAEFEEEAAQTP